MIYSRVGEPVGRKLSFMAAAALTASSCALLLCSFHPVDAGFLGWVAMAPWLVMLAFSRMRPALLLTAGLGFFFFFFGINWVRLVGDTYTGLILMSAILGGLIVLAAYLIKLLSWGTSLPLAFIVPVVWVPLEFVRSFIFTGFPWLFIAHTQHAYLPIIQISDITGAYGVSALLAAVNGFLADLAIRYRTKPRAGRLFDKKATVSAAAAVGLTVISAVYGFARLSSFQMQEGPKLLLVQGNQPMVEKISGQPPAREDIFSTLKELSRNGVKAEPANNAVDMVVWSETTAPVRYINDTNYTLARVLYERRLNVPNTPDAWKNTLDLNKRVMNWLEEFSRRSNVHLLLGATTGRHLHLYKLVDPLIPGEVTDSDLIQHNSVYFYGPGRRPLGRYDKIHLVPVGEYVPISAVRPVKLAIAQYIYKSAEFVSDLEPGRKVARQGVFTITARADGQRYRFGNLICFENVFPDLARQYAFQGGKKGADFLVNESNDAWFRDSAELDQTVAISVFRAVENRVGFVRCANTGISIFIAPDGSYTRSDVLTDPVSGRRKEIEGTLARRVKVCPDLTFYSRYGDTLVIVLILLFLAFFAYALRPKEEE